MNNELEKFARKSLKEGLAKLNDSHRHMFKRMYAHEDMSLDINLVVDRMPVDRLDTAMSQVERTIASLKVKNDGK